MASCSVNRARGAASVEHDGSTRLGHFVRAMHFCREIMIPVDPEEDKYYSTISGSKIASPTRDLIHFDSVGRTLPLLRIESMISCEDLLALLTVGCPFLGAF